MSADKQLGLWIGAVLALQVVVSVYAAPQVFPDTQAIVQFQRAADEYAFKHRRVERYQLPLEVAADPVTIRRAVEAMAEAVRAARPDAREGDLFAPAVQPIFRARIVKAMREHNITVADLEVGDGSTPAVLKVNGAMPWHASDATPPCVLEVLPPLPPELQYRFVGADLVLVDLHASIVVDVLRDAALPLHTIR